MIREYGWEERFISHIPGWNSRLDEIQAAILRVKLGRLDTNNAERARIAGIYDRDFLDIGLILPRARVGTTHVYHQYVVRSPLRDEFEAFLKKRGIGASVHYPVPVHLQPAYRDGQYCSAALPETERIMREVISLPIYPELSEAELGKVISAVKAFQSEHHD